jgi:Restriction endonuclease
MLETLVLNRASTPISIVPYQRIINRVQNHMAIVLKSYENTCIRSSGYNISRFCSGFEKTSSISCIEMPIPSVVQCIRTDYVPKYTNILPFNRKNLYIRDRGRCAYCGKKVSLSGLSFDHVIPRCQGGKTCWENIVLACCRCNTKKGARHPNKYRWPKIMPYAPTLSHAAPVQLVNKLASEIIEESWEDFVYWRIILEP